MTTAVYSTTWAHLTTAQFQAWGSQLSAHLQACGLAQSTDTGQINWSTVAIPTAVNTSAGYEIYHFTDTLQSTSPIFVKIEYGTGDSTTSGNGTPGLWITVGTGSNGSGTLTGTLSSRVQVTGSYSAGAINGQTVSYPTYVCFNGSYLGVILKQNGYVTTNNGYVQPGAIFMVGRGTNTSGAYVANQIVLCTVNGIPSNNTNQAEVQCLNTTTGVVYTCTNGTFTCAWFSPTATAVSGSSFQLYPCWAVFNQVEPINWLLYGLNNEIEPGTTVLATPFGSTQHTYLMTGPASYGWGVNSSTTYSVLMLWE